MKTSIVAAVFATLALALSGSLWAQGRHDERPHGQKLKEAAQTTQSARYNCGGRHDECPHGVKPADTSSAQKPAPEADKVPK